jgi:hypothetical protein
MSCLSRKATIINKDMIPLIVSDSFEIEDWAANDINCGDVEKWANSFKLWLIGTTAQG